MIPIPFKKFLRSATLVCAFVLVPLAAHSSIVEAAPCSMYEGEAGWDAVQRTKIELVKHFQYQPLTHRDFCQLAHLDYKLAQWEPQVKAEHLNRCLENVEKALDHNPQAGIAYFLRGLCLGRQGQMQGLWASLNIIDPVRTAMEMARQLDPALDHGGPDRALGRMLYELPFFLGGDLKKSIEHLETAVQLGPDYWENHYYLAQSYMSQKRYRDAKRELQDALKMAGSVNEEPHMEDHRRHIRELLREVERRLD
ncbi:TRAP transporter TatT component family protein [Nitrospina watsonii]|nr:TRAP transporter TatT component family protein [Nitrospina watsonii]